MKNGLLPPLSCERNKKTNPLGLALSFAVPTVIMLLIYICMEVYPFGTHSVLILDLNGQYVSFYEGLRHAVCGDASLLYSFGRALGGEFFGIYGYYLASPLSYIVALFPADSILEALATIFLIKTGLCGLTFGFYLQKTSIFNKKLNVPATVAFSAMYALSAYCIVQQHNSMWIDAVFWLPIITYGIEELIKKGNFKVFTISLAVSIMSNFYIGWMTCIYCAAYFLVYYFMNSEDGKNNLLGEKAHFVKSLLRMAAFSLLAVAISAVTILTVYYSLQLGKNTFSNTNWSFALRFDILDLFAKFLPSSYDTVRPEGLPFVYCGVLTLLLVPAYFVSKKFSLRQKAFAAVFIGFFILSFVISPVDIFWHGLQKPNWLNYRYSFMLCFFLLTLAYRAFEEIDETEPKTLMFTSAILLALIAVAQKSEFTSFILEGSKDGGNHEKYKLLTLECICFAALAVLVYLIVLCVFKKAKNKRAAAIVMATLICLELFGNGLLLAIDLGHDVVYTSHTKYHDTTDPLDATTEAVKALDDGFYRLEEINHRKWNENIATATKGLSNSTSTFNVTTIRFLKNMGYQGKSNTVKYFGGNPVSDSLLDVKYVLVRNDDNYAEYKNDKMLLEDEKYYKEVFSDESYTVYENLFALPLAYAAGDAVADFDMAGYQNPYERLNALVTALVGSDETIEIFKPLNNYSVSYSNITTSSHKPSENGNYEYPFTNYSKAVPENNASVSFTLSIPYIDTPDDIIYALEDPSYVISGGRTDVEPNKQCIYFYLPSEFQRAFNFKSSAGSYYSCFGGGSERSLFIGELGEGTRTTVTLTLEANNLYITDDVPLFYYLDYETYRSVMTTLAKQSMAVDSDSTDSHITGKINVTETKTSIITSIPYDKGWNVKVDGKKVDIYGVLGDSSLNDGSKTDGALIAFDIDGAGEHTIEFSYWPQILTIGISVSCGAVLIFAVICAVSFIAKKKRKKARSDEEKPKVETTTAPEIPDGADLIPADDNLEPAIPITEIINDGENN
ncbi:MAG: YfhO family protein [Clostridia bacterium]|nr:YfhO family protein [Clostridia bacterium]